MKKMYTTFEDYLRAEYKGPYVATDILIRYQNGLVLIERKFTPLGVALPGGMAERMTLGENAVKEAKEETGLEIKLDDPDRPLCLFSKVGQDPRAFICSASYTATGYGVLKPKEDEDAKRAFVSSYETLVDMLEKPIWAFSHHKKIIVKFLEYEGYLKSGKLR
jgi:ADP-ribose pyrophosphatase YjhB (NUDIX family)